MDNPPRKSAGSAFHQLAWLQWKRFSRSVSFGRKLAVDLFLALLGAMALAGALVAGWLLIPLLGKIAPSADYFQLICSAVWAWCLAELAVRMFFQQPATLQVRPLLLLPFRRGVLVHYVLALQALSFVFLFVLVLLASLGVSLVQHGHSVLHVAGWCAGLLFTSFALGQLALLAGRSTRLLVVMLALMAAIAGLHAFSFIQVPALSRIAFMALYATPWLCLVPLAVGILLHQRNFIAMRNSLWLEESAPWQPSATTPGTMTWADRFGRAAPYIRMDLRMIWRNRRPRSTLFLSFLFLLYGLLVRDPGDPKQWFMLMFCAMFMTGFMVINFGQYMPAWDSAYYSLLMTCPSSFQDYLRSKVLLMRAAVVAMAVFSIPYALHDHHWALPLLVFCLYNLGITVPMVLFFGALNTSRIDLGRSAFGNWQGVNAGRFLLVLLIIAPSMLMAMLIKSKWGAATAYTTLACLSLAGLLAQQVLLRWIRSFYAARKYRSLAGFNQR